MLAIAALLIAAVAPVHAQQPPPGSPIPRIAPPAPPGVAPGLVTQQTETLQNLAPNTPRRVLSVTVEGATTLSADDIAAATRDLVGPATATSAIEGARIALLKRYRDGGFPLVTVAASLTADGKLRYTITEGRIAEVQLDGDIGPAGTKVLEFLQKLVLPGPVNAAALERWLLLAQDVPGVALQTVLRPSESEPGALTLVARVARTAITGLVAADNRAFRDSGPEQVLALAGYNSATSWGERTEISLYKSLFNATQIFGQVSLESFIGSSGLKLRLYAGIGDSRPSGVLRTTGYDGKTTVAGVQLSYPLIYTRQQKLNILGIVDVIQSEILSTGPTNKDALRVLRLGTDYALQDQILGAERPAINQVSVRLSHGLRGFGASRNGSTALARLDSQVDYTKISAELSRNQTLYSFSPDTSVSLLALVAGQGSRDIIPAAEKFYLGGMRFTRGFYAGEVTGDNALAATAELQLNTGFQTELFGTQRDIGVQFYAFYDWGETWENKVLDANKRLRSVGLGTRATLTQYLELDLEMVSRITRQPSTTGSAVKPLPEKAFYWRLVGRF